jgi:hypothetical protein
MNDVTRVKLSEFYKSMDISGNIPLDDIYNEKITMWKVTKALIRNACDDNRKFDDNRKLKQCFFENIYSVVTSTTYNSKTRLTNVHISISVNNFGSRLNNTSAPYSFSSLPTRSSTSSSLSDSPNRQSISPLLRGSYIRQSSSLSGSLSSRPLDTLPRGSSIRQTSSSPIRQTIILPTRKPIISPTRPSNSGLPISRPISRSTSPPPMIQSIIKTYDNRKPIKLKDPRRKMTKDEFFKLLDPKTKIENKKFNDERTFALIATGYDSDLKSRNPIIATITKINPKYPVYDIAKKRNKVAENIQFYFFGDIGHCPFENTQISIFITYYTLYAEVILGDDLDINSRKKIFDLLTQDIDKNSNGNKMSLRDTKYKLNRIMKEILMIRNSVLGTSYGAELFQNNNNNNNGTGSNNRLK